MKRTTIRLDDELFSQTKQFAAKTGRTFQAVIEDALRLMLYRRPLATGKSQVEMMRHFGALGEPQGPKVSLVTFGEGGVQPGIDLDDNASLLDAMEDDSDPAE